MIARWSQGRPPAAFAEASAPREGGRYGGPPKGGPYKRGPYKRGPLETNVITQNVDDLHVRAGTRGLIRLHGSLWELRCGNVGAAFRRPACEGSWRDESVPLVEFPPHCRPCGSLARPAIVWFGEPLAAADVEAAISACSCDVFVTIGTSAIVFPAAGLVQHARTEGAFTAEINLQPTSASAVVDLSILGAAEDILPALDRLLD